MILVTTILLVPEIRKFRNSINQKTLKDFSKDLLLGSGSEDLFLSLIPGPELPSGPDPG